MHGSPLPSRNEGSTKGGGWDSLSYRCFFGVLVGVQESFAERERYDLQQHAKASGQAMEYQAAVAVRDNFSARQSPRLFFLLLKERG